MRTQKNSWIIALVALAGCGTVDELSLSLIAPAAKNAGVAVSMQRGLVLAEIDGESLQYDLYRPSGIDGPLPLVVVVHGGSWRSGSREDMAAFAYDIAAQGYAAASIDYRLVKRRKNVYPVPVADVLTAVHFFRDNATGLAIDPQRIALLGLSAGGHLALLAGMAGDDSVFDAARPAGESLGVRCVVDLFGPTDFTIDAATASQEQLGRVAAFFGVNASDFASFSRATLAQASPVTHARADGPPVLVIHGDADGLVPVDQARRLVAALNAAGQVHEYHEIPGMDHLPGAFWPGPFVQEYREYVLAFLASWL